MSARYNRALTQDAVSLMKPGSELAFLLCDLPTVEDEVNALDAQLREHNQIMYYHGTTRLLTVTLRPSKCGIILQPDAHATYKQKDAFAQLEKIGRSAPGEAREAFMNYLSSALALADKRYFKNHKEGYWQNHLCHRFGRNCQPDDDWLIVDRECVIGFSDGDEKREYYNDIISARTQMRTRLQSTDEGKWGRAIGKMFGDELDLLAIDRNGRLLAIELKHGSNPSGIYWGPLQAGAYASALQGKLQEIVPGIVALVNQKVDLGLLPEHARTRLENSLLDDVTPILAVAEPNPRSSCWSKLTEVTEQTGMIHVVTLDASGANPVELPGVQSQHLVVKDI